MGDAQENLNEKDINLEELSQLIAASSSDVQLLQKEVMAFLHHQLAGLEKVNLEASALTTTITTCNFQSKFEELTKYTHIAKNLVSDMQHISYRTNKLQARAQRLVQESARRSEAQSRERARMAERERQLLARPTWQS